MEILTPTPDDVAANLATIRPHVRRTPVMHVPGSEVRDGLGGEVVMKLEHVQHTGSFKARGAITNLLTREVPDAGVVAASGGNHGAAVAWAASTLGHPAHIFVPENSSPAKIANIRSYGAEVHVEGAQYVDAFAASQDWIADTGAMSVHAYDAHETLLGQGGVGLELLEQADVDTVLVAVGGGGLIGGVAAAVTDQIRVVSVEPVTCPTMHAAREAGEVVDVETSGIADNSLGARRVGAAIWPLARAYVDDSVLVTDDDIVAAQVWAWRHLRQALEPGGAAALAALRSGAYLPSADERVAVILCGANTDTIPS